MAQYQELIAAEYAFTWIKQAAKDVRTGLDTLAASVANSEAHFLKDIRATMIEAETREERKFNRPFFLHRTVFPERSAVNRPGRL